MLLNFTTWHVIDTLANELSHVLFTNVPLGFENFFHLISYMIVYDIGEVLKVISGNVDVLNWGIEKDASTVLELVDLITLDMHTCHIDGQALHGDGVQHVKSSAIFETILIPTAKFDVGGIACLCWNVEGYDIVIDHLLLFKVAHEVPIWMIGVTSVDEGTQTQDTIIVVPVHRWVYPSDCEEPHGLQLYVLVLLIIRKVNFYEVLHVGCLCLIK